MKAASTNEHIPGYDFGKPTIAESTLTDEELRQMQQTVGWNETDGSVLERHADLFRNHAEAMVDSWRAVIGAQPHLTHWFTNSQGQADDDYKARVKRRFVQWVVDVATRPHDRDWLNYQEEIGLRHTPAKKNKTDDKHTPPVVPMRYLVGFIPIVLPIRRFFVNEIKNARELEALESAWTKAVLLHITLWTRPYVTPGLW